MTGPKPWALILAVAAGCSVPPTGLGRDVRAVERLRDEMEAAAREQRFEAALSAADKVTRLGDEVAAKVLLGDPRRERLESALARARELKNEIGLRKRQSAGSRRQELVETMAKIAYEQGKVSREVVKGPPPGFDASSLLASVTREQEAPSEKPSRGEADVDLDRHRRLVKGDKEGDVAEDEVQRLSRAAEKPDDSRPERVAIDENSPPVVIHPNLVAKGNGVAAYFTFVNKKAEAVRIGSVTGDFLRENGKAIAAVLLTYEAKAFEPDWTSIFDSKGKAITGSSHAVQPGKSLDMVCVCDKPKVGKVTRVKIVVTTTDGRTYTAAGPQE